MDFENIFLIADTILPKAPFRFKIPHVLPFLNVNKNPFLIYQEQFVIIFDCDLDHNLSPCGGVGEDLKLGSKLKPRSHHVFNF